MLIEDENVKMGCELVFTEYLLDLFSLPRLRGMTLFVPAAFFAWPFAKKQRQYVHMFSTAILSLVPH